MKNLVKYFRICAFLAIIGLVFAACEDDQNVHGNENVIIDNPVVDYPYPAATSKPSYEEWKAQIAAWKLELEPLIAGMTLAQKAGQMTQGLVDQMSPGQTIDASFDTVPTYFVGSINAGGHNQPNQSGFNGAFGTSAEPQSWRNIIHRMVDRSLYVTSYPNGVKIPLIFGLECVHGASKIQDATMLPHNVGLGAIAVGDAERGARAAYAAGKLTAGEMLEAGMRWTFAPMLATAENARWGRMYECYSENAAINAVFGEYFTRGLHEAGVASCPKTFGEAPNYYNRYGTPGLNSYMSLSEYRAYIAPFEKAIEDRSMSIQMSYASRNGRRIHEDKELMLDLLKGEMGFEGMILTDWNSLNSVTGVNYADRVANGINAGIDMVMAASSNWQDTIAALIGRTVKVEPGQPVPAGYIPMSRIDDAVMRILLFKKSIGRQSPDSALNFWDNPVMYSPANAANLRSAENRKIAADLVADSLVLLKNNDNTIQRLQSGEFKKILLLGQASANIGYQCGGWTIEWTGSKSATATAGVNIEQGIRAVLTDTDMTVTRDAGSSAVSGAFDVVIAVTTEEPYAESVYEFGNISLRPADETMLSNAYAVKNAAGDAAPVIMIVISGRPMGLVTHFEDTAAIIAAWLPGSEAGTGIAEMLFTEREFAGKTPYTWTRTTGLSTLEGDIVYPFGHGLTKNGKCNCSVCD